MPPNVELGGCAGALWDGVTTGGTTARERRVAGSVHGHEYDARITGGIVEWSFGSPSMTEVSRPIVFPGQGRPFDSCQGQGAPVHASVLEENEHRRHDEVRRQHRQKCKQREPDEAR